MTNSLEIMGKQLQEIWRHLGVNQKSSIIIALMVVLALVGGLLYWSSRPDYRLLYTGVNLKDSAAMQEKLADAKIPVQLKDSGSAIYVPVKDVYRGRVLLASAGLPKENSTGFEIFEQPKFGLTDFAQQVNYQRALQGELERTIMAMNGIESARVMLVLPKDRIFSSETKNRASASILVTVANRVSLTGAQVQSIVQFVASGVPGLMPADITVTDQSGKLLTRPSTGSDVMEAADDQLMTQEKLGAVLAQKAQEVLETALGAGNSIVRVSAIMDFSKREQRTERYDSQNKVVKSEMIESENSTTPGNTAGNVAGVVGNVPVGNPSGGSVDQNAGMAKSKKENIRTEYAIPSEVEQIVIKGGQVTGLSVSVCLAKGEKVRSAEELKKIEQLVRNAVGCVETDKRKDKVEVAEMDFPRQAPPVAVSSWERVMPDAEFLKTAGLWAVAVIVVLMIGRKLTGAGDVRHEAVGVPLQTVAEAQLAAEFGGRDASMETLTPAARNVKELQAVAEQNPRAIAAWIKSVSREAGA